MSNCTRYPPTVLLPPTSGSLAIRYLNPTRSLASAPLRARMCAETVPLVEPHGPRSSLVSELPPDHALLSLGELHFSFPHFHDVIAEGDDSGRLSFAVPARMDQSLPQARKQYDRQAADIPIP